MIVSQLNIIAFSLKASCKYIYVSFIFLLDYLLLISYEWNPNCDHFY